MCIYERDLILGPIGQDRQRLVLLGEIHLPATELEALSVKTSLVYKGLDVFSYALDMVQRSWITTKQSVGRKENNHSHFRQGVEYLMKIDSKTL